MGILAAISSRLVPPRGNDFYALARHVPRVSGAELAVAEAALAGGGPIADRFAAQLRDAREAWRLTRDDGSYELSVATSTPVGGVPRAGWRSRAITLSAQPGGRPLEIELVASAAGIVGIHGRALDGGRWPARWSIDQADLDRIRRDAPWMALPTPAELRGQRAHAVEVLETWLGEPGVLRGSRGTVSVEPPATVEAIAAFERVQDFVLPDAYRELLLAANGLAIGSIVLLGTEDAYRLDLPGPARLVIGPPAEDGALVLAPAGEIRFVELEAPTSEGSRRATDLREWLRRSVRLRSRD